MTTSASAVRAALAYDPGAVTLVLTRTDVDFRPYAATRNQAAVAGALTTALPLATSANAATVLNDLIVVGRAGPAAVAAALDRLGGESLAAGPAAALEQGETFMATIADEQRRSPAGNLHLWGGPLGGGA